MLGIIKNLFSPKAAISYADVYGHDSISSNVCVTNADANALPAVYACVNIISTAVASLPILILEDKTREAVKNSLYLLLAVKPNNWQSPFEWRRMAMDSLLYYGISYNRVYRNKGGEVISIIPLHPDAVSVEWDGVKGDFKYHIFWSGDQQNNTNSETVYSYNMFIIRGQCSSIVTPISPITSHAMTIATGSVMQEHKYKFFKNAARPSGVLEAEGKVDTDIAKRIITLFNARHSGSYNSGTTLLLEQSMKYKPLMMSFTDAQFLDLCKLAIDDVCRIYNVPPSMVHQNEKSSYANATQQALGFLKFTLVPYLEMFEQAIKRDIFTENQLEKYDIAFDTKAMLRADNESTANYLTKLVQGGCMSPNEAREYLDLPRKNSDAADQLYIQQNQVSVDQLDKQKELANNPPQQEPTVLDKVINFEKDLNKFFKVS